MVSAPLVQVLASSFDAPGLSVCTANRSPTDPRPGASYDNTVMAAALPVHFHPMTAPALGGGNFMMLNAARWHDATPLATDPGFFNPYTVDALPSWLMVNAANGHTTAVNSGIELPMVTPILSRTLTGAVSRGTDMLYTLAEVALLSTQGNGANLLGDPGFEGGLSTPAGGWAPSGGGTVTMDTSTKHSGSQSVRVAVDSSNDIAGVYQEFSTALPVGDYTLSFWSLNDSNVNGAFDLQVAGTFGGVYQYYDGTEWTTSSTDTYQVPYSTSWIFNTVHFTLPVSNDAVTDGIDIVFKRRPSVGGGVAYSFWVDEATLQQTSGQISAAVIQHWHNNTAINTLNAMGEETVPVGTNGSDTVIFSAGVHYSKATDPYLYVYGTGSSTHAIYVARKNWARVGTTGVATKKFDSQWEVMTATGWDPDFTLAKPMQDGLLSYGPVSVANHSLPRSMSGKTSAYTFLATTQKSGSTMTAQFYSSLGGRAWVPLRAPIALGTAGTTYLGATAQLQPQLGANPALVDTDSAAAVPYVVGVKNSTGGADRIEITWGLLQVPRVS